MIEILVSGLGEPELVRLGVNWRKRDGLQYKSFVVLDGRTGPEQIVSSLRELAAQIETEINR